MKNLIPVLAVFLLSFFLACGNKESGHKQSSGKTAEMIVSTNNQARWEGIVGDTIRAFFNRDFEVLPQSEPLFEMAHVPLQKLINNEMFRVHHNIFMVSIEESAQESTLEVRNHVWSSPQQVISITSPSEAAFVEFFEQKKELILDLLMNSEYQRLQKIFHGFRDREVINQIIRNFQFSLEIPSGFYVATKKADFMWLRKETKENSQGILIYTYPFIDTLAFDISRIIAFRNAITEEYVPGPTEGSFMTVTDEFSPILTKRINLNGLFAVETRGLWKLEGDFMGGPFVNYTFVDERTNQVITVDGYVYAPNAPKRDLLIQVESLANSLKFVN